MLIAPNVRYDTVFSPNRAINVDSNPCLHGFVEYMVNTSSGSDEIVTRLTLVIKVKVIQLRFFQEENSCRKCTRHVCGTPQRTEASQWIQQS